MVIRDLRLSVLAAGVLAMSLGIAMAQGVVTKDAFTPYTACKLSDGLSVVETAPLGPGITSRTVKTLTGNYNVSMLDGRRVMFAYPGEDFYVNVKVELLPEQGYKESKAALISSFDQVIATGDVARNYRLKPVMNRFEIQGEDRAKREGGVLGIYLLFNDATRTVVTIYMLNQEPPKRFHTMEEYAAIRDKFLNEYTTCIRKQL